MVEQLEKKGEIKYGPRPFIFLGAGIVLACVAAVIASYYEVGAKASLDLKGERIEGSAERSDEGVYRIRYKHPSGAIYARMQRGSLGIQRLKNGEGPVEMVYNPEEPANFQPAGLSYIPGGVSVALFLVAMGCLLHGRRLFTRKLRASKR